MILRAGSGNSRTRKARNGGGLPVEGYPLIGDGHTAGRPGNSACPAPPGSGAHFAAGCTRRSASAPSIPGEVGAVRGFGHLGWGDVQRARRLGLSNATFWRHLRDIATEVRHAASVSMTPAGGENQGGDRGGNWHDLLPFHEYFHGDTGRRVGASHQAGWTALVADLIIRSATG